MAMFMEISAKPFIAADHLCKQVERDRKQKQKKKRKEMEKETYCGAV